MIDFIEIYDNSITPTQCNTIIDYFDNNPNVTQGVAGDKIDKSIKDSWDLYCNFNQRNEVDYIIYKTLNEQTAKYKEKHHHVNSCMDSWSVFNGYNIQKYNPGQGYNKVHCESDCKRDSARMLVWMIYLNTVTDGGGTYFDNFGRTTDAVEGRCVIWPASWTHCHRGVVSKTQTKYIVTGWYAFD